MTKFYKLLDFYFRYKAEIYIGADEFRIKRNFNSREVVCLLRTYQYFYVKMFNEIAHMKVLHHDNKMTFH